MPSRIDLYGCIAFALVITASSNTHAQPTSRRGGAWWQQADTLAAAAGERFLNRPYTVRDRVIDDLNVKLKKYLDDVGRETNPGPYTPARAGGEPMPPDGAVAIDPVTRDVTFAVSIAVLTVQPAVAQSCRKMLDLFRSVLYGDDQMYVRDLTLANEFGYLTNTHTDSVMAAVHALRRRLAGRVSYVWLDGRIATCTYRDSDNPQYTFSDSTFAVRPH